ERVRVLEQSKEVDPLRPEQQLLVVRESEKGQAHPAAAEDQLRQRQRERPDERKDGEAQDEEDGGPYEQPASGSVRTQRAERLGHPARDGGVEVRPSGRTSLLNFYGAIAGRQDSRRRRPAGHPCPLLPSR